MILRRCLAAVLMLTMLLSCAAAQENAAFSAEKDCQESAFAQLATEEIHAFVSGMFAAACGTTAEFEHKIRMEMTEDALAHRNAENARYRAKTIAWLAAALNPEIETAQGLPTQIPVSEATPSPDAPMAYTFEDGFSAFSETEPGRAYLSLMEGLGGTDARSCIEITREICCLWLAEVDHAKLKHMNGDYRCWLYAPGTQIDYPVVQYKDNSRYLKRMFNGSYNSAGTLFIDYRNLPGFQDPNTLIYGHHMRNDSMFGTLTDYESQAYFEEHPFMLLMTEQEIFLLEIIAGYTTSDADHCYDIAISDVQDMQDFLREAEKKSDFISGVLTQPTDRLVTLSTCAYAFQDARYVVIARILPLLSRSCKDGDVIVCDQMAE